MALLKSPKIIKEFTNGDSIREKAKNGTKQILRAGIDVATITAGIGYIGAIGMQKMGPIGSIAGMGLGAVIGNKISNKAQEYIS